jgi:hypothetical protein
MSTGEALCHHFVNSLGHESSDAGLALMDKGEKDKCLIPCGQHGCLETAWCEGQGRGGMTLITRGHVDQKGHLWTPQATIRDPLTVY